MSKELQALEIALRALRNYSNMDMWAYGGGKPVDGQGKNYGSALYNLLQIRPPQNGWELAQKALNEINELMFDSNNTRMDVVWDPKFSAEELAQIKKSLDEANESFQDISQQISIFKDMPIGDIIRIIDFFYNEEEKHYDADPNDDHVFKNIENVNKWLNDSGLK